ncbi:MAG: ribonuclease III [Bacteroidaceae bacterium]|nr:ribonuclease III [Bacteroidaceae bacterium]
MNVQNLFDAIRLLFRKDKALYRSFYSILGFYPRHIRFYEEAIHHKSMATVGKEGKPIHNERLEYLGDAILEAVTSDILYRHFPHKREGFLTSARSKMVKRETLGRVAKEVGLEQLIKCHNAHNAHNSYVAGNAFEALIGAIYLDRGYDYCMRFISQRVIGLALDLEQTAYVEQNFKSRLLELCQKKRLRIEFKLLSETRDEKGAPYFHSAVIMEDEQISEGRGYSKRESQQQASKAAMSRIKRHHSLLQQLMEKSKARKETEQTP